ncbi:MAG: hypothetical protein HY695_21310 [Deltaproteobacteria bacterium]|nr:hypothetical protein [Deltaproteobacteria bacterium]
MSQRILTLAFAFVVIAAQASALTVEEVLALRKAGVSDQTIQMMLEAEKTTYTPFGAEYPSSWTTSDGRVFRSTGHGRDVLRESSQYYPVGVYPYVTRRFPRR